jgi:hypothetical protein
VARETEALVRARRDEHEALRRHRETLMKAAEEVNQLSLCSHRLLHVFFFPFFFLFSSFSFSFFFFLFFLGFFSTA